MIDNIRDLIDTLEEIAQQHGDDVKVRLAQQPNWPFEYTIGEVVAVDFDAPEPDSEEELSELEDAAVNAPRTRGTNVKVYIGQGTQLDYLPGAASKALGWKD